MKKKATYSLIGLGVAGAVGYALWRQNRNSFLPVVENVDLDRYMGVWYEIARLPAPFEKSCYHATATYSKNPDGTVKVVNACRRGSLHGEESRTEGVAYVVEPETNAKLKVQFQWPFKGDYYIIDVGKEYEYALVGAPSRKYLWILSRSTQLDSQIQDHLIGYANELGFNTEKLIFTEHPLEEELKPFENFSE